jgi:predicted DCC family thiol-disulfide oxidoreductase YuxK
VTEPQRVMLLYDEDCGFCRWSADKIRAWDSRGALAFASIQGETGTDLLHAVPPERRLDSMHAVTPDGRVWSGGEAVRVIVGRLPGGAAPGWIARAFPEATKIVYRQVVRHRQRLGRWLGQTACRVDPSRVDAARGS